MTCAKQRVTCTITTPGGQTIIGENDCASPQDACPRLPGEDYTKCKTICGQYGHAEISALAVALMRGLDLKGATAVLRGHTYFCMECQHALFRSGVSFLGRE
jgi:deoxycytidylate deaminase